MNKARASIRKLTSEARYNGFLPADVASAIQDVKGSKRQGFRLGTWLLAEQAQKLLEMPDPDSLTGKPDRAMLAIMLGAALRCSEVAGLTVEHVQQREARWSPIEAVCSSQRRCPKCRAPLPIPAGTPSGPASSPQQKSD